MQRLKLKRILKDNIYVVSSEASLTADTIELQTVIELPHSASAFSKLALSRQP
jgi:hypothetical protein